MLSEKDALEQIKLMVQPSIVTSGGDNDTPPSLLDIYNLACRALGDYGPPESCGTIGSSESSPYIPAKS